VARAPKKQPTLDTKRLRLRPFRAGDLQVAHELYGDAKNLRYWSVPASPNVAVTRRMMKWHLTYRPRHYVIWAVEEIKSRKLVGMINYHRRDVREKRVDVGC
jgi:RimJ/RimL family protein N-acetyltransferase